jgi:sorbitol/mannitol transport system substrate-binding protein
MGAGHGAADHVVNTFGGTCSLGLAGRWTESFRDATQFYVDLVRAHGENGAPQAGFTECLNNIIQGHAAMWYDATSAAGSLEAADSPVRGKMGYVAAPVVLTKASGWLYAWSWGIEEASTKKDDAWKFISWASSKQYEDLVGTKLGWSRVPAGKRASTYDNPDYLKEAGASPSPPSRRSRPPTAQPRDPATAGVGIQFVDIPEFRIRYGLPGRQFRDADRMSVGRPCNEPQPRMIAGATARGRS